MGIHDRDYYRGDAPGGFDLRGGWSMTTWLIVVNGAVLVMNMIAGQNGVLMRYLAVTDETLTKPWLWWQLITYGFAHNPMSIGHIFWNMFGLWVFGRPVEGVYGPKEFLRFYLGAIFLGGLFWALRVAALHTTGSVIGASGAVTAVTLLFCIHFPKQTILLMMVLPVPAWFVGGTIILFNVLGALSGVGNTAFDVHLVGGVFAICYYRFGWNFGRWSFDFSLPRGLFKRKPRLRVHSAPDYDPAYEDELAEQADQLLEKINRQGIDSLTESERRILEKHSRRVREKRH